MARKGKYGSSWAYGFIRERLKDGSHALVLAEIYFHGRKPHGCALVSWYDLHKSGVMKLMLSDIQQQQKFNYFLRATDDGLKRGPRGRYATKWLANHPGIKKGSTLKRAVKR